jgi:hypothetical protein
MQMEELHHQLALGQQQGAQEQVLAVFVPQTASLRLQSTQRAPDTQMEGPQLQLALGLSIVSVLALLAHVRQMGMGQ